MKPKLQVLVWDKLEDMIPEMREEFGLQTYLSNIEKQVEGASDRAPWFKGRIEQRKKVNAQ